MRTEELVVAEADLLRLSPEERRIDVALLSEKVYRKLRDAINSGTFKPHGHLVQNDLAAKLGVSRTPVREALFRLSHDGLVRSVGGRGFVVEDVTWHDVEEVYVVRRALELQAVALLPEVYPAHDLSTLRRLNETVARPDIDPAEYYELNRLFHRAVIEPANNDLLKRMLDEIWELPVSHRIFRRYTLSGASVSRMISEHQAILEAAEANDRTLLTHLVDRHLMEAQHETIAWLKER
jgi:DNA-binding GntR family transcriptional regulator